MRIALCLIATAKYRRYVSASLAAARQFFCRNHTVQFFVFSDAAPEQAADISYYKIEHEPWPGPTLHRYHTLLKARDDLAKYDYVYYVDADARFIGPVDSEIFGELVATIHCGYYKTSREHFPYERRTDSLAYIQSSEGIHYYAGGFQGGSAAAFIAAMQSMAGSITADEKKNVIAKWHDESHWNRYCVDHPPTVQLDHMYHWPEEWPRTTGQKLLLLKKDHAEMRSENNLPGHLRYLHNWPLGEERLREEVIQHYHCGKNVWPVSMHNVQGVLNYARSSGLCNRLRALAACAVVAEHYDLPHYITWLASPACPLTFTEGFSYDKALFMPPSVTELLLRRDNLFIADTECMAHRGALYFSGAAPIGIYYEQLRLDMSAQRYVEKVIAKMREIQPSEAIAARIAAYKATWPAHVIGVHVRRTDQVTNIQECYKLTVSDDALIAAMQAELQADPDVRFFLACDNAASATKLRAQFGSAILPSPVNYTSPGANTISCTRHTSGEDAVFDLFCLAATQKLLGTWMSTFSHYAADLGGIPNVQLR